MEWNQRKRGCEWMGGGWVRAGLWGVSCGLGEGYGLHFGRGQRAARVSKRMVGGHDHPLPDGPGLFAARGGARGGARVSSTRWGGGRGWGHERAARVSKRVVGWHAHPLPDGRGSLA